MQSGSLVPIPTPAAQRWKDFRVQTVPVLVFLAAVFTVTRIWQHDLVAPNASGVVEAVQSNVTSPHSSRLVSLNVSRFQQVKKGDPIAVLVPMDPGMEISSIQSELALFRARLDSVGVGQRYTANYEKLHLDVLVLRTKLAATKVRLELARDETQRAEQLFKDKLISEAEFETRRKQFERLQTEIKETTLALEAAEPGVEKLRQVAVSAQQSAEAAQALAFLSGLEKRLNAAVSNATRLTLEAPISGMVAVVYHQPGEQVKEGDAIVTIHSPQSTRILSYLHTPFVAEPTVGMEVEIRSRSGRHDLVMGKVTSVGVQVEPLPNLLLGQRPAGGPVQQGLPFAVNLPAGLHVRPGEIVDLVLRPSAKP